MWASEIFKVRHTSRFTGNNRHDQWAQSWELLPAIRLKEKSVTFLAQRVWEEGLTIILKSLLGGHDFEVRREFAF